MAEAPTLARRSRRVTCVVTVALPLGDITANQLRSLADIARRFTQGNDAHDRGTKLRAALDQQERSAGDLQGARSRGAWRDPGAGTIMDIVTCPGTDTCKLGISSSRGLAAELRKRLARKEFSVGRSGAESAHQDQRLLQQLRPASCGGPGLLRRQPQDRRDTRCRTSRWCWAASGSTTPGPTACRSWPFPRRIFPRWLRG